MRYAVVDDQTGRIRNVIVLASDPADARWTPPDGYSLIPVERSDHAEPCGLWDGDRFVPRDRAEGHVERKREAIEALISKGDMEVLTVLVRHGVVTEEDALAAGWVDPL